MISSKPKWAAVFGCAAVLALSVASAEARGGRDAGTARGAMVGVPYAYQPSGPHAYGLFDSFAQAPSYEYSDQRSYRGSYNYLDGRETGYVGSGTFSDGQEVPGTNWNPNQE